VPVGCDISSNLSTIKVVNNYHGASNILNNTIYRHSGNYSPIFYTIPLFESVEFTNAGNYKFDTTLSNFGIMKERKIGKINRNGSILKLKMMLMKSQYILCWMSLDIVFMTFYILFDLEFKILSRI
jgi:hypothetical protein